MNSKATFAELSWIAFSPKDELAIALHATDNPNSTPPKRGRPVKPDSLRNCLALRRAQLSLPPPPVAEDEDDSEDGNDSEGNGLVYFLMCFVSFCNGSIVNERIAF